MRGPAEAEAISLWVCFASLAMTLLFATRNRHKVRELRRIFKGSAVRFLTADQFPDLPAVYENGATFQANAVKKALVTSRHTILPVLAEDSGLEVQALNGRPGVRSARYALRQAQGERTQNQKDQANVRKLLKDLSAVPSGRRQARFVCVMALAAGGKLIRTFEGSCLGTIALQPAGRTGFGYDPVFMPRGHRGTMSQLGARIKDSLSHRRKAAENLRRFLLRRTVCKS